jgi:hypothetical protein
MWLALELREQRDEQDRQWNDGLSLRHCVARIFRQYADAKKR